jgi:hypothetical protein
MTLGIPIICFQLAAPSMAMLVSISSKDLYTSLVPSTSHPPQHLSGPVLGAASFLSPLKIYPLYSLSTDSPLRSWLNRTDFHTDVSLERIHLFDSLWH